MSTIIAHLIQEAFFAEAVRGAFAEMACCRVAFAVIVAHLLLLLLISPRQASSWAVDGNDVDGVSGPTGDARVDLSVYYETLCPFCANFIANHLVKVLEKGLPSIVNLRMIPWGNAFVNSDNTFVCQHGPDECMLNTMEACTISAYPQVEKHLSFIFCVERLTLGGRHEEWASCFNTAGLGEALPMDCYKNGHGKQLELQFAEETAHLDPPHTYVPWVLVNNQPIGDDYENFVTHVCKAYKGSAVPEACRSFPSKVVALESTDRIHRVCYADDVKNSTSFNAGEEN